MLMTKKVTVEITRILDLVNTDEIKRMGKLFNTSLNNYFYDTGTGKVIHIDDEVFYIMNLIFKKDHLNLESILSDQCIRLEKLEEFAQICISENLIRAYKPETLFSYNHCEEIEDAIKNNLEQLILELTGKCNLRCKYCIYNDEYIYDRAFNSEDMLVQTAQKAVDYFFEHSKEDMAVTFYGGEPLVKYDLMKWVIDYSLEKNKKYKKKMSFSLTSNLTLVTEEIADYLAQIPELHMVCSLDGPVAIQNANRVYRNGDGCFNEAFRGLKLLSKSFNKYNKALSINIVFAPDFSFDKLDNIESFYNNLEFLPENTTIEITYPVAGSINTEKALKLIEENPKYMVDKDDTNPLWKWKLNKLREGKKLSGEYKSFASAGMLQSLSLIDRRYISEKPNQRYALNACCVPGERRLYVDTKGVFYPCERIGTCPDIGNVDSGLQIEKIKTHYVDKFIEKSIGYCKDCWAIRLCSLCYANRYTEEGFANNETMCYGSKNMAERYLSLYHEYLESNPEKLEFLNEVTIS